jgi:nitroimidazol reductase NimA-like FMN-containing flavoprotein (pyridoxamine 5'-phosphate oxidase superfamily)
MASAELPVTGRTRVRRLAERQVVDPSLLDEILAEALIAHVAAVHEGVPIVLPFAFARDGDAVLLHGSTGAGVLRACASGQPISVAITHLDGLVVARSAFDNSMNYRSAVIIGVPELLSGPAKERALRVITDHLLPGRTAEVRPSTNKETAATLVLRLPLTEVSVKARSAAAIAADDPEDRSVWAGVLPLARLSFPPLPSSEVPADVRIPDSVRAASDRLDRAAARVWEAARLYA